MQHNVTGNEYSLSTIEEERGDPLWALDVYDNLLLKQKVESFEDLHKSANMEPTKCPMSPTILINDDEDIANIEIARIDSYYDRNLTPEGNVKYKNYKVMAQGYHPVRMYSPSGDIHTTPKKGKIMPKYDLFDDLNKRREKLLTLISEDNPFDQILRSIIKPAGTRYRILEALRESNVSSLDDYVKFLNSVNYSPSPSYSMFSEDVEAAYDSDRSSPDLYVGMRKLCKSQSIDEEQRSMRRQRLLRQISMPSDGVNSTSMCLSDELKQADRLYLRSHTPKAMEQTYNYRPISSLSVDIHGRKSPLECKKSILRSFVQRNMISESNQRDNLAKLALAIEEDTDDHDDDCCSFMASARLLDSKVVVMLDEIKDLKDESMEIQEDFQDSEKLVTRLLLRVKNLSLELQVVRYVEDIIKLLNEDTNVRAFESWPFAICSDKCDEDSNINLIV